MGTPPTPGAFRDALYDWAGKSVAALVRLMFDPDETLILDGGAGWGKYRWLLPEYRMHAVEIWEPNVVEHRLSCLYGACQVGDVCDVDLRFYDAVILGDVLEHIDRPRAVDLCRRADDAGVELFVVVPYEYEQGEEDGNPFEAHVQDDLTPELMAAEYPMLRLLGHDNGKGLYVRRAQR